MKLRVLEDLAIYSQGSFLKAIYTILLNTNFHAVSNYRLAHIFFHIRLVPICKVIMVWNKILYSVDIDYRAELAGGFQLMHGMGVVIGKDVKTLGAVKVYQNVTLGGNNGKERQHKEFGKMTQPILKSGVTIFTGACCFGPIIIGSNSTIGAMAVCTHDIPENHMYYNKTEHIIKEM